MHGGYPSRGDVYAKSLSVVIPTKNEAGNVRAVVRRLVAATSGIEEIIFVDDSDDSTPAVLENIRLESETPVIVIHRSNAERRGGLGTAVLRGMQRALLWSRW